MIRQGLNHHGQGLCLSAFVPKGFCLLYQSLRGAPLMKAFSVKDLQATIGINAKETGKVDRHALKRVSNAYVRTRNFSNHDEN